MAYLLAWSVYLASALLLLLAWWQLMGMWRLLPRFLRELLWGCTLVLLLTPWFAGDSSGYVAPAFMVLAFEFLSETEHGGGSGIALASACALVPPLVVWRARRRRRAGFLGGNRIDFGRNLE